MKGIPEFTPRGQRLLEEIGRRIPMKLVLLDHGDSLQGRSAAAEVTDFVTDRQRFLAERRCRLEVPRGNRQLRGPEEGIALGRSGARFADGKGAVEPDPAFANVPSNVPIR